jgi:integrase
MIFRYGYRSKLLAKEAEFGVEFEKPSAKTLRQVRSAKGPQLFAAEQIQALLKAAEPHMQAMILLAINGGLGNTDLALLTSSAFDLDGGWLDYPRPKTGMPRRIPLWPETVAAVRKAIEKRRPAKSEADAKLLFIGARGTSYVNHTGGHRVAAEFARLRDEVGMKDRVFYDLRRTFQTVADNLSRDRDGVKAIMGHAPASGDMSAIYRQGFDDDRLRAIVDHVHGWLFAKPAAGKNRCRRRK